MDRQQRADLELHRMSGFGVRPALISAILCETTLSQYWSVRGTVCSSTPAALHTCIQQQLRCLFWCVGGEWEKGGRGQLQVHQAAVSLQLSYAFRQNLLFSSHI